MIGRRTSEGLITSQGLMKPSDLAQHADDAGGDQPTTAAHYEALYVEAMAAAERHAECAERYRDYETWDIANLAAEDVERARDAYLNVCESDGECVEIGCRAKSDNDLCTEHAKNGDPDA